MRFCARTAVQEDDVCLIRLLVGLFHCLVAQVWEGIQGKWRLQVWVVQLVVVVWSLVSGD